MFKLIRAETYEKLRKAIKDEEAVMYLVRDLEENIEKYFKELSENFEYSLYSKLIQKLVTKEEFKSEINRLDQKIDSIYQKLDQKIDFVYKDLSNKMDYQYQALQSEIKRLEVEIKRVEQNINTKFWILAGIMIVGFAFLNPYTGQVLKVLFGFLK